MPHQRKTEEEGENAVGTVHKIISVTIRVIVMLRRPGSGEGEIVALTYTDCHWSWQSINAWGRNHANVTWYLVFVSSL